MIRYKNYPIYGVEQVLYTGFMIRGKCEGYGIMTDEYGRIYYQGEFLKGKIHAENAVIYRNNLKLE